MDNDMAGDLYQDTVLRAFEIIDRIDAAKNPKAFFFSIAVGKWKNFRRKAQRRNAIAATVPLKYLTEDIADCDNPECHAENALLKDCVGVALAKMDDKYRIPMILFYFDDFGSETIANICDIPVGTVKSRLYKGRSILKGELMKEGFEHGR
jgi:RNA polymerase sigma-70 factor (ECF subfamily)